MTELSRDEVAIAVERMKRDDWSDDDRALVLRLPPNERDAILLLAALLDARPVD